jgi:hypothetical protein
LPKVKNLILPWNNSELDLARARVSAAKKSGSKEERKLAAFDLAKKDGEINATFIAECINKIHNALDAFKTRVAYQMVKKVTESKTSSSVKLAAESPTARLRGWTVYFSNLLGGNIEVEEDLWEPELTEIVEILDINKEERTLQELTNEMRNNKASGLDNITAEALKVESFSIKFLQYINEVINNDVVFEEWQKNIIIALPKKGEISQYANYRGISSMSIAGKIYNRILLHRIREKMDGKLRPN